MARVQIPTIKPDEEVEMNRMKQLFCIHDWIAYNDVFIRYTGKIDNNGLRHVVRKNQEEHTEPFGIIIDCLKCLNCGKGKLSYRKIPNQYLNVISSENFICDSKRLVHFGKFYWLLKFWRNIYEGIARN